MADFVRVELWNETLSWGEDLGDGSLVGAIAKLNELASVVQPELLPSVRFEFEDDGYESENYKLKIWYERPKTPGEFEAERVERENYARTAAEHQEQVERAALAALKAKYGE